MSTKNGNTNGKVTDPIPIIEAEATIPIPTQEELLQKKKEERHIEKIQSLVRHIGFVNDACQLLGSRLIKIGELEFGRILIANGLRHDKSKFHGIEWEHLWPNENEDNLKLAHKQHVETNEHHPEFWGGITYMPRVYIAEMVADWYSRSNEFGKDLRAWIKDIAMQKYNMACGSKVYKNIKQFVDLLLDPPFKNLK